MKKLALFAAFAACLAFQTNLSAQVVRYFTTATTGGLVPGNANWITGTTAATSGTTALWSGVTGGAAPFYNTWTDNAIADFRTNAGTSVLTIAPTDVINAAGLWVENAGSQNALTINGGAIQFNTSGTAIRSEKTSFTFTINSNLILNADNLVFNVAQPLTINGSIKELGGSRGFTRIGTGNALTLGGVSTFTGTVFNLQGNMTLTGSGGMPNADLVWGHAGQFVGGQNYILTVTATVSGTYRRTNSFTYDGVWRNTNSLYISSTGVKTVDQFGPLTLKSGLMTISALATSATIQAQFDSFSRPGGGSVLTFTNNTIAGLQPLVGATGNAFNTVFNTAPAMSGTGALGTPQAPVIIGALQWSTAYKMATYDPAYGVRPLNSSEVVTYNGGTTTVFSSTFVPGSNVYITAGNNNGCAVIAGDDLVINSLCVAKDNARLTGTNTKVTLLSGMVYMDVPSTGIYGDLTLDLADSEGIFFPGGGRTVVVIPATITGSHGLSLCGNGASVLIFGGSNTVTGTTRLIGDNASGVARLANDYALQYTTVDYNNYGASLNFGSASSGNYGFSGTDVLHPVLGALGGNQNLDMLNKGPGGATALVTLTVGGNGESTTYSGTMIGVGASLIKTGTSVMRLAGINTYTGSTAIVQGMLEITGTNFVQSPQFNNFTAIDKSSIIVNSSTLGIGFSGTYILPTTGTGAIVVRPGYTTYVTGTQNLSTLNMLGTEPGGTLIIASATIVTGATGAPPVVTAYYVTPYSTAIGSARLNSEGTIIFNTGSTGNDPDWSIANSLSGGGLFIKTGTSELALTGVSTQTGTIRLDNGTLRIANGAATGPGAVVNNTSTPNLLLDFIGACPGAFTGTGVDTVLPTTNATLTGNNTGFTGRWDVFGHVSAATQTNVGSGIYNILDTGTLTINPASGGFTFGNVITGAGVLEALLPTGADQFNLASTSGTDFAGTVLISRGSFVIGGNGGQNNTVLSNATLATAAGATVTVASGTNNIGSLTMGGGRYMIDITNQGDAQSVGIVHTGMLNLNSGTYKVDTAKLSDGVSVLLVKADRATGASNLGNKSLFQIVDQADVPIAGEVTLAIHDSASNLIGSGTKKYALNTGAANDGLYITYGFFDIVLNPGKTLIVGGPNSAQEILGFNTLLAAVSGDGNMIIDASQHLIALSGASTITGTTTLASGTLRLNSLNTLSPNGAFVTTPNTFLDVYGSQQTVKSLTLVATSTIGLDGGGIAMLQGSTVNGGLIGAGNLAIQSGTLTVNGANQSLSASIEIAQAATAATNNVASLGTGTLTFDGNKSMLLLNAASPGTLSNALTGAGVLVKQDNTTLTLAKSSAGFSGTINQMAGQIIATRSRAAGSAIVNLQTAATTFEYLNVTGDSDTSFQGLGGVIVQSSTLTLNRANSNATYDLRNSYVTANDGNALGGSAAAIKADATTRIDLAAPQTSLGHLTVAPGTVLAFAPSTGTAFSTKSATIAGLDGTGATFIFNFDFSIPHNSLTAAGVAGDYITLTGSNTGVYTVHIASGDTTPSGFGAYVNTMELIKANTLGDATFVLDSASGSIDLGINAYELRKGDGTSLMPDPTIWYLADTGLGLAADAILDTASLIGADWFMNLATISTRMGEIRRVVDSERAKPRGDFWLTAHGYQLDADNSLTTRSFKQNAYGVTVGADKIMYAANSTWLLGAMADFTSVSRKFTGNGSGSTTDISLGVYAAWLHNKGAFVTLDVRTGHYANNFDSSSINQQDMHGKYNNQSIGASAEAGWRLTRGGGGLWVEPSVNAAYVGINSANYDTTPNYSKVSVFIDSSTGKQYGGQLRAGYSAPGGKFHPYVRLAASKVSMSGGEIRAVDKHMTPDYSGTRIEAGLGFSWFVNPDNQLYFSYDYATASGYKRPVSISAGFRHAW